VCGADVGRAPYHRRVTGSRKQRIIEVLEEAFADLMAADARAFTVKYRKMAADPFAFFRGTACLYYADVTRMRDRFADDRTSRIWIHGDLHAENFGTYLNSDGRLAFDVNDFDEAYVGHFSWDLRRFAVSLALIGFQKALPHTTVQDLIARYVRAYLGQVNHYLRSDDDLDFGLYLDTSDGPVLQLLTRARRLARRDFLDEVTGIDGGTRVFTDGPGVRRLGRAERRRVLRAFEDYLTTIPESKRFDRQLFYEVRDVVGRTGFGIGSAGLPAYNVLVEGYSQALDNDVVLSMKQANVPAVSRFVDNAHIERYFDHEGHRTVVSQRALQVHTDPLLGHTSMDGRGYVVAEVSPYEVDLDWSDLTEPAEMAVLVDSLGRASAKVHCASDEDSDQTLVDFQVEEAIATVLEGRRKEFVAEIVGFGVDYAARVRRDHGLFVSAFREGEIGGVTST
jgi:uncharacterized protein (DUF2252 family)